VDEGLRILDRCIDVKASLGPLGILGAVVVVGLAEALEVLATSESMEVVLLEHCKDVELPSHLIPFYTEV